jgi:hypothetical protein
MANDTAKNLMETKKNSSRETTAAGTANKPSTRNEVRKTGVAVTTPTEIEEVSTVNEGRKFLEQKLLLCPPNEEFTLTSLISCLHQISRMSGITKTVATAVKSITCLAEELEEVAINTFVRDAVNSQLGELTTDVKTLVNDIKEKLTEHIQTIPAAAKPNNDNKQQNGRSYADTLINPPSHANPRLAAREGIKARQFMLEGPEKDSRIGQMNGIQLKGEFNKKIGEMGHKDKKLRSAMIQRHRGILIEMETDDGATWLRSGDNRKILCVAIGSNATFKPRTFSLIAYNVALTVEPDNQRHKDEICEANHMEAGGIASMRWAKLPERRSAGQKTAHLIIAFTNANAANRAITEGFVICNRKAHIKKVKRDPIRCMKCQGWNHFAKECILTHDRCGNCAEEHRTDQCPNPQQLRCFSCNTDGHASWSKECPTYIRKIEENDRRNPENNLQFIPTDEPWTWTARPEVNEYRRDPNTHWLDNRTELTRQKPPRPGPRPTDRGWNQPLADPNDTRYIPSHSWQQRQQQQQLHQEPQQPTQQSIANA